MRWPVPGSDPICPALWLVGPEPKRPGSTAALPTRWSSFHCCPMTDATARKTAYTLPPRAVQGIGVILFGVAAALPWTWLMRNRPRPLAPLPRLPALRPELRILPPGKFTMGSPDTEAGRYRDEDLHEVEITVPFALSTTEVTQGQYQRVMEENPSQFKGDPERPVDSVSWLDAVTYCNRLSKMEGLPLCYEIQGTHVQWKQGLKCLGYRLPTEAEWEYAARADGKTLYAGSNQVDEVAWYQGNSDTATHPVGKKRPNDWGLYDLSGNVWEWVWDPYEEHLGKAAMKDPLGPSTGSYRLWRGGSWNNVAQDVRVALRGGGGDPSNHYQGQGFRLARSYP